MLNANIKHADVSGAKLAYVEYGAGEPVVFAPDLFRSDDAKELSHVKP